MNKILKKTVAGTLSLLILSTGISFSAFASNTLDSFNFDSDIDGKTPSYISGSATVSSKKLDATNGKRAMFSSPSQSQKTYFTAEVKATETFSLRIYDGASFESVRITPSLNSESMLYAVLDSGNLSVIYENRQIVERKVSTITNITDVEIKNAIIDDVKIGEQEISPIPINLNMYIDGDSVKLGYMSFSTDGKNIAENNLSVKWYKVENNVKSHINDDFSISKPTAESIMCEVSYGDSSVSIGEKRVDDLDVLVFDYPVKTAYSAADNKQIGITLKNHPGNIYTPKISDWSDYDELVLRAESKNATGRIYQADIKSGTKYYFTFFTADWGNNKEKDVILKIGEESSLDASAGGNLWQNITQVDLVTLLSTKQKESGTLTADEKNTQVIYNQIFLRKNRALDSFEGSEYILNAEKVSNSDHSYADDIIKTSHPRILLTNEKLQKLKTDIVNDTYLKCTFEALEETVGKSIDDGALTIGQSSRAKEIARAALLYNLNPSDDLKNWINSSIDGLIASDRNEWNYNSGSFLNIGDTTRAMAFTYDWMYNHWDNNMQMKVRNAIMHYGIEPAIRTLRAGTRWAGEGHGNWNQSILSGIGLGVLAICDSESYADISNELLERAIDSLSYGLRDFSEEGAYSEGVSYWHYAMDTFIPFEAALSDICKMNGNLLDNEKMALTGYFPLMMTGSQGIFSFADSNVQSNVKTAAFYRLSEYFDNPAFGAYQYDNTKKDGGDYLSLILYDTNGYKNYTQYLPNFKYYPGNTESFVMRNGYGDKDSYLAFKGGKNGISHSQLDIGTFVYDVENVRWISDLGRDSYDDYANKTKYYRNRAEGNNCLVINPDTGLDQVKDAISTVTEYSVGKTAGYAVLDMTSAYDEVTSAKRGFAMLDNFKTLVVQDEISANNSLSEIYSFMHTQQDITISADKKSAVIKTKSGDTRNRQVYVKLLSDVEAELSVMDAELMKLEPSSSQEDNSNYKKLTVKATNVQNAKFAVVISTSEQSSYKDIIPLNEWDENIPVTNGTILVNGEEYNKEITLEEGTHTINASYENSGKKGPAVLYIAHYSGDILQKVVFEKETLENAINLNTALTNTFKNGDIVKVFVWTDKLVPIE